jgi:hypothetical protein
MYGTVLKLLSYAASDGSGRYWGCPWKTARVKGRQHILIKNYCHGLKVLSHQIRSA